MPRTSQNREYNCRYCQEHFTDDVTLSEHIYSSDECRIAHNSRNGSSRRRNASRQQRTAVQPTQPESEEQPTHPEGEDEVGSTILCSICMVNKPKILSVECGHLCVCIGCSKNIYGRNDNCPICRGPWKKLLQAYF